MVDQVDGTTNPSGSRRAALALAALTVAVASVGFGPEAWNFATTTLRDCPAPGTDTDVDVLYTLTNSAADAVVATHNAYYEGEPLSRTELLGDANPDSASDPVFVTAAEFDVIAAQLQEGGGSELSEGCMSELLTDEGRSQTPAERETLDQALRIVSGKTSELIERLAEDGDFEGLWAQSVTDLEAAAQFANDSAAFLRCSEQDAVLDGTLERIEMLETSVGVNLGGIVLPENLSAESGGVEYTEPSAEPFPQLAPPEGTMREASAPAPAFASMTVTSASYAPTWAAGSVRVTSELATSPVGAASYAVSHQTVSQSKAQTQLRGVGC